MWCTIINGAWFVFAAMIVVFAVIGHSAAEQMFPSLEIPSMW